MRQIVIIAHDMRSCHNVGSLLRTAEGIKVENVYLTGYTPFPKYKDDPRLPHMAQKIHNQIAKTALGAESTQSWQHSEDIYDVISTLKADGYTVAALEQSDSSVFLHEYDPPQKIAIILGREVEGLDNKILAKCDRCLEIPMLGKKESFNVVQAAAMVLYHCRYS